MKTWWLEDDVDPIHDRALTHGLGVFETMLALGGRLVRPDLHFERLATGCQRLDIAPPDEDACRRALRTALTDLALPRARVRVMRTAGPGALATLAGDAPRTHLSVSEGAPPPESLRVVTAPWPLNERSPLAGVKAASYADHLVALDHARRAGADEAIFANTRDHLAEAATANIFLVFGGEIATPTLACGCLPGTARRRVIDLARGGGFDLHERPIPMTEAREADEIFLTSATRGVVRVSSWDDRRFAEHPVTERLRLAFEATLH